MDYTRPLTVADARDLEGRLNGTEMRNMRNFLKFIFQALGSPVPAATNIQVLEYFHDKIVREWGYDKSKLTAAGIRSDIHDQVQLAIRAVQLLFDQKYR